MAMIRRRVRRINALIGGAGLLWLSKFDQSACGLLSTTPDIIISEHFVDSVLCLA